MTSPRPQRLMGLSILAAVLNIGLKGMAYHVTGSAALLADAGESVINLLAALVALVALWYAARPVDETHTYGHEKIEYLSSGLEGALILAAAVAIAWYAVRRLFVPQALESLHIGSAFTVVATLLNLLVGRRLVRVGRQARSIALEADGHHLMTDVYTSAGTLVATTTSTSVAVTGLNAIRTSPYGYYVTAVDSQGVASPASKDRCRLSRRAAEARISREAPSGDSTQATDSVTRSRRRSSVGAC